MRYCHCTAKWNWRDALEWVALFWISSRSVTSALQPEQSESCSRPALVPAPRGWVVSPWLSEEHLEMGRQTWKEKLEKEKNEISTWPLEPKAGWVGCTECLSNCSGRAGRWLHVQTSHCGPWALLWLITVCWILGYFFSDLFCRKNTEVSQLSWVVE